MCLPDGSNELATTPKIAVVAGVKFHRTRTGNFVPNRVVQDHRYVSLPPEAHSLTVFRRSGRVKKIDEPCRVFSTTGIYLLYPYIHTVRQLLLAVADISSTFHRVSMGTYGQF